MRIESSNLPSNLISTKQIHIHYLRYAIKFLFNDEWEFFELVSNFQSKMAKPKFWTKNSGTGLQLNWTVQTTENGRSCVKLDGPRD